jgi:hypothetical protein
VPRSSAAAFWQPDLDWFKPTPKFLSPDRFCPETPSSVIQSFIFSHLKMDTGWQGPCLCRQREPLGWTRRPWATVFDAKGTKVITLIPFP